MGETKGVDAVALLVVFVLELMIARVSIIHA